MQCLEEKSRLTDWLTVYRFKETSWADITPSTPANSLETAVVKLQWQKSRDCCFGKDQATHQILWAAWKFWELLPLGRVCYGISKVLLFPPTSAQREVMTQIDKRMCYTSF